MASLLENMRASNLLENGNLGSTKKQKELEKVCQALSNDFPEQLGKHIHRRIDIMRWMAKSCKRSY